MKSLILASVICLSYSFHETFSSSKSSNVDSETLENIGNIFGRALNKGYGCQGQCQEMRAYQEPDDYVEAETFGDLKDKATTEVDSTFENCQDYTESLGFECVPYYQCHNGTVITNGAGLIDIRNGFGVLTPEDSKCPGFLDVCCKDPDFVPPPPPKLIYEPKCGRRNHNGLGVRIQGFRDSESQFGEWPHMCAVLHEEEQQVQTSYSEPNIANVYQCGGSLIAPGVILTAAHCVDRFKERATELKVRCGEWDTQNETEPYPHQDRHVKDIAIHPLFDPRTLASDWALLFTAEDFILASHIDTVCLPEVGELFDGTTCFATGWGKDKFGSAGEYQVVLKEIALPVVDQVTCQHKLRQTKLGHRFKLHDSFICAGGEEGKDTCRGDGGSPLVCPSRSNPYSYVQAGIVAWGIGCGENGTPGVYASISKAACWIDHVMSCHYGALTGDFRSINGYRSDVCIKDLNNIIEELQTKVKTAGKHGRIFQEQIKKIQQCQVAWQPSTSPRVPNVDHQANKDQTENNEDDFKSNSALIFDNSPNYLDDVAYNHPRGSNLVDVPSKELSDSLIENTSDSGDGKLPASGY